MKTLIRTALFVSFLSVSLFAKPLYAEIKYDIKEMTPAVQTALENRKNRFEELRKFKSQGIVGENNSGYAELLLDNRPAKDLVNAENRDRETIYRAIEEQNNLKDALMTIEKVFAQVQRDKAISGEKVQNENGTWYTK